jgi:hypothetical protein
VRFHRNPGRHRAPDPSEFAAWAGPLRAQQPHVEVRPNPDLAARQSAAATTMPLPIPSRERVAEAMDALRLGTPARPFDGIVQQAAPLPAVHEGLAPAAVPHLPRVRVVDRTEDTVTLAVLGPPRPPALPAALPVVRPPAPLVKRVPRHVPPQVLPTGQARMRALYTRMWEDLNTAHGRTMILHQDAANAARENDERARLIDERVAALAAAHADTVAAHAQWQYAAELAQHAEQATAVAR